MRHSLSKTGCWVGNGLPKIHLDTSMTRHLVKKNLDEKPSFFENEKPLAKIRRVFYQN